MKDFVNVSITIGGPQATVELKARKALDGSLLIMDHTKIDIAVLPKQMKITTNLLKQLIQIQEMVI